VSDRPCPGVGIEAGEEGALPDEPADPIHDEPADPIHYEMKIPQEPKPRIKKHHEAQGEGHPRRAGKGEPLRKAKERRGDPVNSASVVRKNAAVKGATSQLG
jgi:hypothetical protein